MCIILSFVTTQRQDLTVLLRDLALWDKVYLPKFQLSRSPFSPIQTASKLHFNINTIPLLLDNKQINLYFYPWNSVATKTNLEFNKILSILGNVQSKQKSATVQNL